MAPGDDPPTPFDAETDQTVQHLAATERPTGRTAPDHREPESRDLHNLVRRALAASAAELRAATTSLDPGDRRRHHALDRWFAGFATEIRAHHELLELGVLPPLVARKVLDRRAVVAVRADHAWVDRLLAELADTLGVLSFGLGDTSSWSRRAAVLSDELELVLGGQLAREAREIGPLVLAHFDDVERDRLRRALVRGVTLDRASFAMPWLVEHLDDAERDAVLAAVPGPGRLMWRSRRRAYRRAAATAFAGVRPAA